MAQVFSAAAFTSRQALLLPICLGVVRATELPSPSCAELLSPQHHSVRLDLMAHAWREPALISCGIGWQLSPMPLASLSVWPTLLINGQLSALSNMESPSSSVSATLPKRSPSVLAY